MGRRSRRAPPLDGSFAHRGEDGAPWSAVPGPEERRVTAPPAAPAADGSVAVDPSDPSATESAAATSQAPSPVVPQRTDEEARFIAQLVARDERAFSVLVRTYEQRVFALVLRMLGNRAEAEDLAQEVFVQVFKAIGTFRSESKLSTWIYRIAINLCKNRRKYLRVRHTQEQEELDAHEDRAHAAELRRGAPPLGAPTAPATAAQVDRPDEVTAGRQVERIVQRAILALEPTFRECLVLRDVEELSYEEIGQITGLPEGTVKSRIHRARTQLKELVEEALGEKIR
jgi:RNA polymerase sigma-70 factor, ECF subfamily